MHDCADFAHWLDRHSPEWRQKVQRRLEPIRIFLRSCMAPCSGELTAKHPADGYPDALEIAQDFQQDRMFQPSRT
jgi:hypothetical protein